MVWWRKWDFRNSCYAELRFTEKNADVVGGDNGAVAIRGIKSLKATSPLFCVKNFYPAIIPQSQSCEFSGSRSD